MSWTIDLRTAGGVAARPAFAGLAIDLRTAGGVAARPAFAGLAIDLRTAGGVAARPAFAGLAIDLRTAGGVAARPAFAGLAIDLRTAGGVAARPAFAGLAIDLRTAGGVAARPAFAGLAMSALCVLGLSAACSGRGSSQVAAQPAPAPAIEPHDPCSEDRECVVTNFPGCCACPQCVVGQPTARSQVREHAAEEVCAEVKCSIRGCNVGGGCPEGESADHYDARCRAGICVAEHR